MLPIVLKEFYSGLERERFWTVWINMWVSWCTRWLPHLCGHHKGGSYAARGAILFPTQETQISKRSNYSKSGREKGAMGGIQCLCNKISGFSAPPAFLLTSIICFGGIHQPSGAGFWDACRGKEKPCCVSGRASHTTVNPTPYFEG